MSTGTSHLLTCDSLRNNYHATYESTPTVHDSSGDTCTKSGQMTHALLLAVAGTGRKKGTSPS